MYALPMYFEGYVSHKSLPIVNTADKSSPTGLFSTGIFGVTEEERVTKSALINLNCYVLRPLILNVMKRVNRKLVACLTSRTDCIIKDGVLDVLDSSYTPQEGDIIGYGPTFLYENWDKLDKNKMRQAIGKWNNIELKNTLSILQKDEAFQHYQYVIPIGFREEDSDGMMIVNEINQLYEPIIRYSNMIGNKFPGIQTRDAEVLLQKAVLDFFEYLKDRYLGPHGVARKQILSRAIDNSSRMVILPAYYTNKKLGKSPLKLDSTGIPMHHLISMFRDTILKYSRDFINVLFDKGLFPEETTSDLLAVYDVEFLTEKINKMEDPYQRILPFPLVTPDGDFIPLKLDFEVLQGNTWVQETKELSWIEFFYIVCITFADISNTRYTAATRYPIESFNNTQFLRPVPLTISPKLLRSVKVLDWEYEDTYPYVDDFVKEHYQEKIFEQGSRNCSAVTVGWNGDHDESFVALYSKECEEKSA